jgi:hypothetical protein
VGPKRSLEEAREASKPSLISSYFSYFPDKRGEVRTDTTFLFDSQCLANEALETKDMAIELV